MAQLVSLGGKNFVQRISDRIAEKPVLSFLFFWTVLNLVQVSLMELTSDEGYYWFYAQRLQWGYYDHPPMIALLIKLGTTILPGELGVRFFNVVLSTAGLALFFRLLPHTYKQSGKTYLVLLAAPLLHYLTFLLFPDGPLLFFSLLFLLVYKRFLAQQGLGTAVLLGVVLALMAYSKYHGALVLSFTILANPGLLRQGFFYLALLVAAVLFAPHLWWQYANDFPTLKYHLSGRTEVLSFRHVGEYLSQQLVAIGPGMLFIPFVCRANDVFERTLKFIIIGSFLFFLLSSFKTFVHFHWTSIALYPLLYFAVRYYQQPGKLRWFRWAILPFVVLFFFLRILLAVPFIPNMHVGEDYYHGREAWAKELALLAGDRPLFMPNNLRETPLYTYYSGKPAVTLYTQPGKKSQYELWGYEDSLQAEEVLLVSKHAFPEGKEKATGLGQGVFYAEVPSFQSYYNGVEMKAVAEKMLAADTLMNVAVEIINNRTSVLSFEPDASGELPRLLYAIEQEGKQVSNGLLQSLSAEDMLHPGKSNKKEIRIPVRSLIHGSYHLRIGIRSGLLPDAWLVDIEGTFANQLTN